MDSKLASQPQDDLDRRDAALKFLEEIAVATNELSDVETVFHYALQRCCAYTDACIGHVYLVDPAQPELLQSSKIWEERGAGNFLHLREMSAGLVFRPGESLPGRVMLSKQIETLESLEGVPLFQRAEAARETGLRAWMAFPILAGEEAAAVFEFFFQRAARWDQSMLDTLTQAGTLLGRVVERQRSMEALRSSEVRFRAIFQGVGAGIELLDLEGRLLAFNPAACRFFGYSHDEMVRDFLGKRDHPGKEISQDTLFATLAAGKIDQYSLERRFHDKDDQLLWGHSTVSLVRDLNQIPQYAICMIEDVTERKLMEAELVEMHRRLMEGKEEERLRLAREIHDGPIQDLYGLMYSLKAAVDSAPGGEALPSGEELLERLERVIATLRAMSSELRPSTLAPFGLEKSIRSHAHDFQQSHPELQINLRLTPDGTSLPEPVRLALFRIYQVSLTNVLRHAEASQVDIVFEHDGSQAGLEIRDNGKGFVLPERWIQLARRGHLGLVGAVERAEAVGGKLEIQSSPGKGTLVRVVVPLPPSEAGTAYNRSK